MSVKEQAGKMRAGFGKLTASAVVSNLICMVLGAGLCFFGYKLLDYMLLLSGFCMGYLVTFFLVSEVMTLAGHCNCWALGLVPLVGALAATYAVRTLEDVMFFLLGAMIGLCFNHLVYILILAHVEAHMSGKYAHGLLYYGGTVVWVIGFGVLAVKLQHKILALATSVIGGPVFSLGFWSLLAEIFPKMQEDGWNAWSHPCTFDNANPCTADDGSAGTGIVGEARDPTSVEVLVPTLFTWLLVIVGFCVQLYLQKRDNEKEGGGDMSSPLMGYGGRPASNLQHGASE